MAPHYFASRNSLFKITYFRLSFIHQKKYLLRVIVPRQCRYQLDRNMGQTNSQIKLYGSEDCHKTKYYKVLLEDEGLPFDFLDVKQNEEYAQELRSLYENRNLNFPTITIGTKKLRNPTKEELLKWLDKLVTSRIEIVHDRENQQFTLNVNGDTAFIDYITKGGKLHLMHTEVPNTLRGRNIGKELVFKTFEKLTQEGYKAVAECSYIKAVKDRDEYWKQIIA